MAAAIPDRKTAGMHTICCIVNEAFLQASARLGNDLDHPYAGVRLRRSEAG